MKEKYSEYLSMVEGYLAKCFVRPGAGHEKLLSSMRYSLMAGGKRIRPVLVLEFCRICGGDPKAALPLACGVEMLHTYSLIHDDLPCMDDDDLRRGKPTNHVVYGEMTAVLAGDALQAGAFYEMLSAPLTAQVRAQCACELAAAAGEDGICGGQMLDMESGEKTRSEQWLNEVHRRKTAALINAACRIGAIAGGADEGKLTAASDYAEALGLAFQIRDDMLDEISTVDELGKPIGSDSVSGKETFMTLYGEERCEKLVLELTERAKNAVLAEFGDADFLCSLADSLAVRRK